MATKHRKKSRAAKKIAVMGAATATAAALTAGLVSPIPESLAGRDDITTIGALPVEQRDVQLAAIAGFYGVGPIFWIADALGITPEAAVLAAVGLLDDPAITAAVQGLFAVLGTVVETGAPGPLPSDVYNAVNGLDYTTDLILGLVPANVRNTQLGALGAFAVNLLFNIDATVTTTVGQAALAVANQYPILKQRRAIILSESLGGLTTSLAYRDMIEAVQSNSADWEPGVTGQWLIFVNNPSRPGGGLFALATPLTNLLGVNLTTPEGGSYTNAAANGGEITKILNTSVLDVTWAYSILSDAPTTLNPLAWANAAAGGAFITYLIPDGLNFANTNLGSQTLPLLAGLVNGAGVLVDPTGGQGTAIVPILGDIIEWLGLPQLPGIVGTSTYITYDSGNLPLLEPFDVVPRLLGLLGVDVPQPVINSIEDALRMAINAGYQDVDPLTLERTFAEAGEQAYIWHSALTPSQQFRAGWTITNELVNDVQASLLNPVAWTPSIVGQLELNAGLKALIQNPVAMTLSGAVNGGIDALQAAANPAFNGLEIALKPALDIADDINQQAEDAIDSALGVGSTPFNANLALRSGEQNAEQPGAGILLTTNEKPDGPVADGAEKVKDELSNASSRLEKRRAALKEAGADIEKELSHSAKSLDAAAKKAQAQADKTVKKARAHLNDIAEKGRKDIERAVGGTEARAKKHTEK